MEETKDPVKSWERPWTTDEMRQHSANWNLAGDAGLLRHLQQFSQNLIARTHATEVALDSLMERLRATSTEVSNVTNQFLCLADTQFLENRVYDDDEKESPPEGKEEEAKPKSKDEQEAEVVARVRDALALGMSVLDNMFDTVEVPASDSEDEESSGGRVVLEPRNPYLSRPLPYLIGSRQFMEDDHVGLGSPSDSEENGADKNLAQSSESESEMEVEQKNVPKKRTKLSSTSASENSDFEATDSSSGGRPAPGKQKKLESSGLFDSIPAVETGNMFGEDSPMEDAGVVDDVGPRDSFASELAAKLGGVAAAAGTSNQPAPKPRTAASKPTLEWGEEEDDNGLFGKKDGKFSGGQGLFDDLEDSPGSLWGTKDKTPADKSAKKPTEGSLFGPDVGNEDDIFSGAIGSERVEKTKRLSSSLSSRIATSTPETGSGLLSLPNNSEISNIKKSPLFDRPDVDSGDLFGPPKPTSRDSVQVIGEGEAERPKKKKPIGAVSIFGSVDVFKAGIRRPPSSSSCSSDESVPTNEQAHIFNTADTSSGIGKSSTEQQNSTKGQGISASVASGKVSIFDDGDDLFNSVLTSPKIQAPEVGKTGKYGTETTKSDAAVTSNLFDDELADDSLFSKPQKNVMRGSGKPAPGGSSSSRSGTTSRKPVTLFNDSDSADEELLFSSTSSTSSRSRRSQGSGDLLAAPSDKTRPTTVQNKGLFENEDELFSGPKDDPGFDIFSTGANATSKPNPLSRGNEDLFEGSLDDPEFNLFRPSNSSTSVPVATRENLRNGGKDMLFGDDDGVDIFGGTTGSKIPKSVAQVSVNNNNNNTQSSFKGSESVRSSSGGLFSNNSTEYTIDDIFAAPVNKSLSDNSPSKSNITDGLFSGSSVLEDGIDDLFAGPAKPKKDVPTADVFKVQTDDMFTNPRTMSGGRNEDKVVSKDVAVSDSTSKLDSVTNDIFTTVPSTSSNASSGLFNDIVDKSTGDLFGDSVSRAPIDKKPVIASKPVISPKPKLSPVSKPSLFQDSTGDSDIFSTSKPNSDKISSQLSSPVKEKSNKVTEERILTSDNTRKPEQQNKADTVPVNANVTEKTEQMVAKEPPLPTSKLEPPKTLNIRKTTGLLFSSSSNEEEDLFGMSFPGKVSLDTSSAEVIDEKPTGSLSAVLQSSSGLVEKPTSLSTEKRSRSEKEISSKVDSSRDNGSGAMKARSVGASPRQFDIDPTALLPGARPPPRGLTNVEAAVSFDRPAQLNKTLHSAGKERARIQTKRRPPSRKARQEAVRTSGIDFEGFHTAPARGAEAVATQSATDSVQEPGARAAATVPDILHTTSKPPPGAIGSPAKSQSSTFLDGSSNLLSPSTDEEDLFGVPQDLPSEYGSVKDDGQNLFSTAPVLSPLAFDSDTLPEFPPSKSNSAGAVTNTVAEDKFLPVENDSSKLLKAALDTLPPPLHDTHISSNGQTTKVPSSSNLIPSETRDSLHVEDDSSDIFSESKKIVSSSRSEKQDLFGSTKDSESLFSSVKPMPKLDLSDHLFGKDLSRPAAKTSDSFVKDPLPLENDPLSMAKQSDNILGSSSHEELFGSGPLKDRDELFLSSKSSGEKVHDLFLPAETDSVRVDSGGDLFSSGAKTASNKESRSRTCVDKSDIFEPKEVSDVDDDVLFSSGSKQKQPQPTEEELFPNPVKNANVQKLAAMEKKSGSDLFGGDSPDIFTASPTWLSPAYNTTKGKQSGTVKGGSLFDEDEGDDIFGAVKSDSKSAITAKPTSTPLDNTDALFSSGLAKKKPRNKVNKAAGSGSSRQAEEAGALFEDPLMVVTKK